MLPPIYVPASAGKDLPEITVKHKGDLVEEGGTIRVEGKKWGAIVPYQASATLGGKRRGRPVPVTCNPPSPARVRVGRTQVRCRASVEDVGTTTFLFSIRVEADD
jgi:hypothetical protein